MFYIYMCVCVYRYHMTPATWKLQNFWKRTCILPGVDKCGQCGLVSKWLVASSSTLTTSVWGNGPPPNQLRSHVLDQQFLPQPQGQEIRHGKLRGFGCSRLLPRLLQKPAESNIRQRRCGQHQPLRPAISAIVIIVISLSLTSLTS